MTAAELPQDDPTSPEVVAPDEAAAPDFTYVCPRCGLRLDQFAEACPKCGADLGDLFSTTYSVRTPPAARTIALVALIGLALLILLVAASLLGQWLGVGPPEPSGGPSPSPA